MSRASCIPLRLCQVPSSPRCLVSIYFFSSSWAVFWYTFYDRVFAQLITFRSPNVRCISQGLYIFGLGSNSVELPIVRNIDSLDCFLYLWHRANSDMTSSQMIAFFSRCVSWMSYTICQPTTPGRSMLLPKHHRPTAFLCGWSVGVEFLAGLYLRDPAVGREATFENV